MARLVIILRKLNPAKACLLFVILVPFYLEFLSYVIQSWKWPSLKIPESDPSEQQRILFVADPQLQGFKDEPPTLGYITRWDADRYLRRTFQLALSHHQADTIVYLGDLLDEGSPAEDQEYSIYYQRFMDIFSTSPDVKHIYISGDNDVGGEGMDKRTDFKVKRFRKFFKEKPLVSTKYIDFVVGHYNAGQELPEENIVTVLPEATKPIRILLSHLNLLTSRKENFMELLRKVKPNMIFTAHTHVAYLFSCIDCYSDKPSGRGHKWLGGSRPMNDYSVFPFNILNTTAVHEVIVPACSYRMGVPQMGYGAAVIDKYGHVQYTVLWQPSRYHQLFAYLYGLVCLAMWCCLYCVCFKTKGGTYKTNYSKSY